MKPTDIIMKKRMGGVLTHSEICAFVDGACNGSFADYQLSALLMAICIRGMNDEETAALTMAMAHSGETVDLSGIEGVKADKHSTGGVGDTTTLIVAPLVAACGLKVAKMSGRGLGFTGGTLDKLESIPGFNVNLTIDEFKRQVCRVGLSIIGQTADIAPADKVLYALRDVTATVDNMSLITASILSKKIAAGCDVVVLDVKTGSGALFRTEAESIDLAEHMVRVGQSTGRMYSALVTDMDQPLGNNIGNALEVEEAIRMLSGEAAGSLLDVSLLLGGKMLVNAGLAETNEAAACMLNEALKSGGGLSKLGEMIGAQGGDARVIKNVGLLPRSKEVKAVRAASDGYISTIQTHSLGYAALALGAGRTRKEDMPDPAAGIVMRKRIGDYIERGEVLCEMHTGAASDIASAEALIRGAVSLGCKRPLEKPLIHAVVNPK